MVAAAALRPPESRARLLDLRKKMLEKKMLNESCDQSQLSPFTDQEKMCLSWKQTNLLVQGWVSIDRSEVAALLSTTPRPKTRSSTNDLAPPRRMGSISCRSPHLLLEVADNDRVLRLNHRRRPMGPPTCIRASRQRWHWEYRHKSGRDSDLEAFSHNPSDGSLAPLAYQPSTSTKCLNLRFLSY